MCMNIVRKGLFSALPKIIFSRSKKLTHDHFKNKYVYFILIFKFFLRYNAKTKRLLQNIL